MLSMSDTFEKNSMSFGFVHVLYIFFARTGASPEVDRSRVYIFSILNAVPFVKHNQSGKGLVEQLVYPAVTSQVFTKS